MSERNVIELVQNLGENLIARLETLGYMDLEGRDKHALHQQAQSSFSRMLDKVYSDLLELIDLGKRTSAARSLDGLERVEGELGGNASLTRTAGLSFDVLSTMNHKVRVRLRLRKEFPGGNISSRIARSKIAIS